MTGTEIYKRTPLFEKAASNIRLHAPQWKVLLAFDGQRSLAEVALSQEVSFAEALPLTEKFLDEGWIEEQPITLDQYLKRTGAADVSAIGAAITPAIVLHEAKPVQLEAPPVAPAASQPPTSNGPPPPLPTRPAAPVAAPVPARAPIAPVVKAAPIPAAAAAPKTKGSMRLKAVVDFIVSQVGNNSLGQLMVYRIFLRVSPQLLQDEDIASVHLANDPSVVKNEQLQRGIEEATMEVLKRPLPESVYSPA
jgi:hypothetical protein